MAGLLDIDDVMQHVVHKAEAIAKGGRSPRASEVALALWFEAQARIKLAGSLTFTLRRLAQ